MNEQLAIFLCDESGIMAAPWAEAGYECYCVDTQHSVRRERVMGNIHFVYGDVRTFERPQGNLAFLAGFPPCTDTTVAGARDFVTKGEMLLQDAMILFNAVRQAGRWAGCPWMVEQPIGVLSSIPHIGKPAHYFHPSDYTAFELGDNYSKKTAIWCGNGFVMPEPKRAPGLPAPDDRIHKCPPSADRATIRSKTPMGFARAVFEANSPLARRAAA